MNFGEYGEDVRIPPYIFCLLFKKKEKVQDHDQYSNQIRHHFDVNFFFLISIIKILRKGGPRGLAPISLLRSEYSSYRFHSNTPNSRHFF